MSPRWLAAGLVLGLAACGRPTGDFERAEPSLLHDRVLPFGGDVVAAYGRREQVSSFRRTDREETLRDRAWALVVPPYAGDWLGDFLVEGQRTRLLPEIDGRFDLRGYYRLLRGERYRSSEARYHRLLQDMRQDGLLVGPFWAEVRRVAADDRARLHALDVRRDVGPRELADAYARIDENARTVDWTWRAVRFRIAAYRFAIDRLAVETPSVLLADVDLAWTELQVAVAAAQRGSEAIVARPVAAGLGSRHRDPASIEEPVPQK